MKGGSKRRRPSDAERVLSQQIIRKQETRDIATADRISSVDRLALPKRFGAYDLPSAARLRKTITKRSDVTGEHKTGPGDRNAKLKIKKIEVPAQKIKSPPLMEEIGLTHPLSLGTYGLSTSGKSTLMFNLLTNPDMYGGYFDELWLMAPTADHDDTLKRLNIPKNRVISKNFAAGLERFVSLCADDVKKHGILKSKKRFLLIDDATALRGLMHSEALSQAATSLRHLNASFSIAVHKWTALIHVARLNLQHHMIFPLVYTQIGKIADELQPSSMSDDEFYKMIAWAWTETPDTPKPFLWVRRREPVEKRFIKCLDEPYESKPVAEANEPTES